MAFNPGALFKMKERMELLQQDHPKFLAFLSYLAVNDNQKDTLIEIKVTRPDGKVTEANLKLTENDVETLKMMTK